MTMRFLNLTMMTDSSLAQHLACTHSDTEEKVQARNIQPTNCNQESSEVRLSSRYRVLTRC